jgi:DNA-binding protein HU-beta
MLDIIRAPVWPGVLMRAISSDNHMATKTSTTPPAPVKTAAKPATKAAAKTGTTKSIPTLKQPKAPAKKSGAKKSTVKGAANKAEFVELIAAQFELPKTRSAALLDFVIDTIKAQIRKTGTATVAGLGTFKVSKRAARKGRNPSTGEPLKIKASKSVRFKPTPTFKDEL